MISDTSELELPNGVLSGDALFARAKAELVRFLPAWLVFFHACALLNSGLTNFSPSRVEFTGNVVFPMAVFVGFYLLRAARAPDVERRWLMAMTIVGLAVCAPLLIVAIHRPSPVSGKSLLWVFELSNFVLAALVLWHAWRTQRSHAALFFGAGFLYGLLLENGGIVLGFFHETNLTLTAVHPLPAPVATMLGWCIVLSMACFVVWQVRQWVPQLRRQHALSAVLVAASATMLDLQIDPVATAAGAWVWNPTLPPFFHGVPLVNFVAWLCALTPFAWAMFRAQERHQLAEGGHWPIPALRDMVVAVPGALLIAALMFIVATGAIEGLDGPSWALLNQFAARVIAVIL